MTENPNKPGPSRPWVGFEREYSLVTANLDWYQNDRGEWCLAVEDDASHFVLAMIEAEVDQAQRASRCSTRHVGVFEAESNVPILEVIIDHGSAFINPHHDERPCPEHAFEGYLDEITSNTRCARLAGHS